MLMTIPTLLVVGWATIVLTSASGLSPSAQLVQSLEKQTNNAGWAQKVRVMQEKHIPGLTYESLLHDEVAHFDSEAFLSKLDVNHMVGGAVISDTGQITGIFYKQATGLFDKQNPPTKNLDRLLASQQAREIIHAAFANDQRLADLAYTFADGQTIAVSPMLDPMDHHTPVGVVFVAVSNLDTNSLLGLFPQVSGPPAITGILCSAFVFILMISLISMLFGVATARRITQRLQGITTAVHDWSRGNFQMTVNDASADELGQLAQDLNQMARRVQELFTTHQQLALMEERQRVARNLHDSVKQQAFGITLLIGAARKALDKDTTLARSYLAEAGELADQTRQELTLIIREMRPLALLDKGLIAVLQDYIQSWSRRTGIATEVQFQQWEQAHAPEIEEVLLRVTQEALANVARHSQASQVRVTLARRDDQYQLQIHDNGHGFVVAGATSKGLGLSSMHERSEQVHGTLRIESDASGTLIEACLPAVQACIGANEEAQV